MEKWTELLTKDILGHCHKTDCHKTSQKKNDVTLNNDGPVLIFEILYF